MLLLLVLGPTLFSCADNTDDKPSEEAIARIEATLAKTPCIGRLDRWERRYYFKRQWNNLSPIEMVRQWEFQEWIIDPEVINIDLREAMFAEFGSGKHIYSNSEFPPGFLVLDDRDYFVAFGTHDLTNNSTELWACGRNVNP